MSSPRPLQTEENEVLLQPKHRPFLMNKQLIRQELIRDLVDQKAFWSYDKSSIKNITDDILIEKVLVHLDIQEIDMLFTLFPSSKIKKVWRERLVPQGEYYYTLNRFLAWYYFNVKQPDVYLKAMTTRHLNSLFA